MQRQRLEYCWPDLFGGPASSASLRWAQWAPSYEYAWAQLPPPAWHMACHTPLYMKIPLASFRFRGSSTVVPASGSKEARRDPDLSVSTQHYNVPG